MLIPPGEKIVETKKCRLSGKEFVITDRDLEFYDKISPVFGEKKYSLPTPTLCPDERKRKRMMMRNDRALYYSSVEGKLSVFSQQGGYTSFQPQKYWSDEWSPQDYAVQFDFQRSAFDQFHDLNHRVPKLARSVTHEENCDFVNQVGFSKDCYLIFGGNFGEKLYYGNRFLESKNCFDFLGAFQCEYCYEIVDCVGCFGLYFSQECMHCRDSYFLYACSDCEYCFGCINLVSKKYCFFNEQLSESEYKKRMHDVSFFQHRNEIKLRLKSLFSQQFFREHYNQKSENCIGNKIINSENVFSSFIIMEGKDIKYSDELHSPLSNCHDIFTFGDGLEFCYESSVIGHGANHCLFCLDSWENVSDLFYCMYCSKGTNNCFLSTGLKKGSYCILNTSYSIKEYETLCGKIIDHMRSMGEWGEFFSHSLSPFGYNETVAQEYYPMTESEVKARGWNWHTEDTKPFTGNIYLPLPITEYDERIVGFEIAQKNIDAILAGTILCEVTGKPFKIIKQELVFYIEQQFPIPIRHPNQRHRDRLVLRNPRTLFERNCSECGKEILTTYAPERPEKVVCEACYRKLVY